MNGEASDGLLSLQTRLEMWGVETVLDASKTLSQQKETLCSILGLLFTPSLGSEERVSRHGSEKRREEVVDAGPVVCSHSYRLMHSGGGELRGRRNPPVVDHDIFFPFSKHCTAVRKRS